MVLSEVFLSSKASLDYGGNDATIVQTAQKRETLVQHEILLTTDASLTYETNRAVERVVFPTEVVVQMPQYRDY